MGAPDHDALASRLLELNAITHRLRRECPWDREQDERSIVPHTIEESYELAEAAHAGNDAKLLDELGDVLFQVYFLAMLLEERGSGDLEAVARSCTEKLIRRHPHVFGEQEELSELPTDARTPGQVRENWDEIKRREGGDRESWGPTRSLPALLYASKIQKQVDGAKPGPGAGHGDPGAYDRVGTLLWEAVELSRRLKVDPEVALRRRADSVLQTHAERPSRPPTGRSEGRSGGGGTEDD